MSIGTWFRNRHFHFLRSKIISRKPRTKYQNLPSMKKIAQQLSISINNTLYCKKIHSGYLLCVYKSLNQWLSLQLIFVYIFLFQRTRKQFSCGAIHQKVIISMRLKSLNASNRCLVFVHFSKCNKLSLLKGKIVTLDLFLIISTVST